MLRAFAALFVVYLHAFTRTQFIDPRTDSSLSSLFALSGNSGVDLFFVISGYIMFHVHYNDFGKGRSLSFLKKRMMRVIPIYWILTTVALVIVLFMPRLFTRERGFDLIWVIGSYLFFPVAYTPSEDTPLLQVGWTLNYEAYFYCVLAFMLTLDRTKAILAITFLFVGFVVLGVMVKFTQPIFHLLSSALLLEFLLGGYIAVLQHVQGDKWRRFHIAGLFLGISLLFSSLPSGRILNDMDRLVAWGLPAALIVNGVCRLRCDGRNWLGRVVVALGDASYSIYLISVFSLPATSLFLSKTGITKSIPADIHIMLLVLATAWAGYLTWRFIESPLTSWLRDKLNSEKLTYTKINQTTI